MSKIFISTTLSKAQDCFSPNKESAKQNQLKTLGIATNENPITQFGEFEIYFHYDTSNPSGVTISDKDYILWHSESNNEFVNKFSKKAFSNHNTEEVSKFRMVYKILLDGTITDKYSAIKSAIFPDIDVQVIGRIGCRFLDRGGVDAEQIENFLGNNYTDEIKNIIEQNKEYHQKKSDRNNTSTDDEANNKNWEILQKALKASNGK